jgi:hypothetical protein
MKYLFFFKGQPLLLCCVCCKIAIQDFLRGLHKKIRKFTFSPTDITTKYNPSVFHRELQKNYGFCHIHRRLSDGLLTAFLTLIPTEYNPSVFHRELQKNYGILPQSLTDYRRRFRRDYRRNYRQVVERMPDTCPSARIPMELPTFNTDGLRMHAMCPSARIPMEFPTFNTDGITDGPRMHATCPSAHIPTEFPTALPTDHACLTRVRLHVYRRHLIRTERKSLAGFSIFLVLISINFHRNYRRKLIAPTAINFRR